MTTSRRRVLATGATGALALTAGCLDFALGNGPLEIEAERAAPSNAALAETDYEEYDIGQETIEERVEVASVERGVEATIKTASYTKEIEYRGYEDDGCFFAAVSIPDVSVAGRSFSPIDDMSNAELIAEFRGELEGGDSVDDLAHRESFGLEILGDGREVDVFEGETTYADERIDVELAMSSFAHEDDLLVLLGSYPAALAGESATVEELMESVEHPV